jgi:UDP-N-acetylglucosamine:LPS N-acetylglucosamine transferase
MTRIAVCVYTTNAAETIRAVEIASAIARLHDDDDDVITFFTYRGNSHAGKKRTVDYEHLIQGFDVSYFGGEDVVLDDVMWQAFRQAELNREGVFPPPYDVVATKYLRAVIDTLTEYQPDIIVYGLFPEVALAAAIQGWKSVSFSAIERNSYMNWLSRNSDTLGKLGLQTKNGSMSKKNPWSVIQNAAIECGLKLKDSHDFMNAIRPSHTALCDFERFYEKETLTPGVTIVGPIISSTTNSSSATMQQIEAFLKSDDKKDQDPSHIKVLLSMGSTGNAQTFVEGFKALNNAKPGEFRSVVMVPACLHDSHLVNESLSSATNNKDILIVKGFVPVRPILPMVDVLICHGGQLSVQCGLAAGLPIIGVPSQADQCLNLQNIEECNAGVCILPLDWKEKRIREALHCVGNEPSYKTEALKMQHEFFRDGGGAEQVASLVWDTLTC